MLSSRLSSFEVITKSQNEFYRKELSNFSFNGKDKTIVSEHPLVLLSAANEFTDSGKERIGKLYKLRVASKEKYLVVSASLVLYLLFLVL